MNLEVVDLRKGDRFLVLEPVSGTFGPTDIVLINVSVTGVQISHPQPLRIGTRARLWFKRGDVVVATQARVVWSHLAKAGSGGMSYLSGLRIENADPQYALVLNSMIRGGLLRQDVDSLERKRQRMIEREEQRKATIRVIPTSEPPPS